MCFFIPEDQEVQIADKDITCFKSVWANTYPFKYVYSLYQNFEYHFNEIYRKADFPVIKNEHNITNDKIKIIYKGFHSHMKLNKTIKRQSSIYNTIIVKCVIPKGSKYFFNDQYNEYVSGLIIIKKWKRFMRMFYW